MLSHKIKNPVTTNDYEVASQTGYQHILIVVITLLGRKNI
jgi:hypothetical protein